MTKTNKIIRSNRFLFLENHETRKVRIYFKTYLLSNIICKTRSIVSKKKTLKNIGFCRRYSNKTHNDIAFVK